MTPDHPSSPRLSPAEMHKLMDRCVFLPQPYPTLAAYIRTLEADAERYRAALEKIARHDIPFSYDRPEKWCNEFIDIARNALSSLG